MKPPLTTLKGRVKGASGLMSACQEGSILQLYGNRKFWAWHSSVPPPTYLFIGLFICILYYILYNKPVMVGKPLSEFCVAIANY